MKTTCRIWASDMRPDRLPHVCVVTGEATEDTLKFKFSTSPTWTLLFILIGLVPYIIAAAATAKRAAGPLPTVRRVQPRIRLMRWGGWLAILAGFIALILSGVTSSSSPDANNTISGIFILLAMLLIVGGIVAVILRGFLGIKGRVEGVPGVPDNWVTLSGVHPAFADAVLQMYAERAAQAPQPVAVPYAQPYAGPVYQQPYVPNTPPPADAPLPPPYTGSA